MWIIPLILVTFLVTPTLTDNIERIDPETCPPQMDIAFLLDTSGSTEEIYREHVNWTLSLVSALPVHKDAVRVSVIQYAESPIVEFNLEQYEEKSEILKHLEEMKFQSGVTKSGAALRAAEEQLFIESNGARKNVTKCIVIFTDGLSIDDPINPSYHLRNDKGVKIYVISIGITGFVPEMLQIAGEPENVFGPSDSERFKKQLLLDVENSRTCPQDLVIGREVFAISVNQTEILAINASTKFPVLISDPTFTIDYPEDDVNEIPVKASSPVPEPETTTILSKTSPNTANVATNNKIINKAKNLTKTTELLKRPAFLTEHKKDSEKTKWKPSKTAANVPVRVAQHAVKLKSEKLLNADVKKVVAPKEEHERIIQQTNTANRNISVTEPIIVINEEPKPQLPEKVRKVKKVRRIIRRLRKRKGTNTLRTKPLEGRRKIVRKVVHKSRAIDASIHRNNIHNESIIPELPAGIRTVQNIPLQTIKARSKFIHRPITPTKRQSIINHSLSKHEDSAETITFPTLVTTLEANKKTKLSTVRPWINPNKLRYLSQLPPVKIEEVPVAVKPVQKQIKVDIVKTELPVETSSISVSPTKPVTKPTTTKPVAKLFAVKTAEVENDVLCPLDILFIVDSSGSIQNIYDKQKTYLSSLLQAIDPQLKSHRVSLIQFSSAKTQKMEWTFDSYSQNEQLMKAFNGVRYFTGTTYIGAALKLALTELETRREHVPTIVVLVSDGFSQDDAIEYSNKINALKNVEFFIVSLATLNNNKYLGKMVETDGNVYIGKDAEFFRAKLLERLECN